MAPHTPDAPRPGAAGCAPRVAAAWRPAHSSLTRRLSELGSALKRRCPGGRAAADCFPAQARAGRRSGERIVIPAMVEEPRAGEAIAVGAGADRGGEDRAQA